MVSLCHSFVACMSACVDNGQTVRAITYDSDRLSTQVDTHATKITMFCSLQYQFFFFIQKRKPDETKQRSLTCDIIKPYYKRFAIDRLRGRYRWFKSDEIFQQYQCQLCSTSGGGGGSERFFYYPGQKKRTIIGIRCSTCDIMLDSAAGAISAGQVDRLIGDATVRDFCPAPIAPDQA